MAFKENRDKMAGLVGTLTDLAERSATLPWAPSGWSAPINGTTGQPYRGINRWTLSTIGSACYPGTENVWFTFKQARSGGGTIPRGATRSPAVMWRVSVKDVTQEDGSVTQRRSMVLANFGLFHWTQVNWGASKAPSQVLRMRSHPPLTPDPSLSGLLATLAEPVQSFDRETLLAEMVVSIVGTTMGVTGSGPEPAESLAGWVQMLRSDPMALSWAATRADKQADALLAAPVAA